MSHYHANEAEVFSFPFTEKPQTHLSHPAA